MYKQDQNLIDIVIKDYENNLEFKKYISHIDEDTKYFTVYEDDKLCSIVSIKYLDWDSNIFNKKIGLFTVCYGEIKNNYSKILFEKIDEFCIKNKYECLFTKLSSDDYSTIHMIEDSGYRLMDSIITLKRNIAFEDNYHIEDEYKYEVLNESSKERLLNIIDNLYSYGRFFSDPSLDKESSNTLYKEWIINEIKNPNIDVIGIKKEELVGFITCKYNESITGEKEGIISLVGVDKSCQGMGIGKLLIKSSINNFYKNNVKQIYVGTQIDNINALNLYINMGFKIVKSTSSFHKKIKNSIEVIV